MSAPRPNRFRRLARCGEKFSAWRSSGQMMDKQTDLVDSSTPPDVMSVRAKSQRHGKSTADKWNQ